MDRCDSVETYMILDRSVDWSRSIGRSSPKGLAADRDRRDPHLKGFWIDRMVRILADGSYQLRSGTGAAIPAVERDGRRPLFRRVEMFRRAILIAMTGSRFRPRPDPEAGRWSIHRATYRVQMRLQHLRGRAIHSVQSGHRATIREGRFDGGGTRGG